VGEASASELNPEPPDTYNRIQISIYRAMRVQVVRCMY
jgi:hypothetical protein